MAKQRRYLSYLLRLWQTGDSGQQVWRASLESPGTGERRGFVSLREMFDFLLAQTEEVESQDEQAYRLDARE
jgi:hypothetical protein